MTAPAFTERAGEACARCDTDMVITYDALRRPRKRCPKCDGVSKRAAPNADTVLVPVQLVPLATVTSPLPAIEPGQLRCQLCARGVERNTLRYCVACSTADHLPPTTTCLGCGAVAPRSPRGRTTRETCPACPRSKPLRQYAWQSKVCACGCGETFQPTGPRALYVAGHR